MPYGILLLLRWFFPLTNPFDPFVVLALLYYSKQRNASLNGFFKFFMDYAVRISKETYFIENKNQVFYLLNFLACNVIVSSDGCKFASSL